jgi:hypothetical protein
MPGHRTLAAGHPYLDFGHCREPGQAQGYGEGLHRLEQWDQRRIREITTLERLESTA